MFTQQHPADALRAHSTPDPDAPVIPEPPKPSPMPDDVPPPVNAPVEEPRAPQPPIKVAQGGWAA